MFEDATFESMGTIHTRSRNWMLATLGLNMSVLAALIAIPLLHPSMLPRMMHINLLEAPAPVDESRPVVRQEHQTAPVSVLPDESVVAPSQIQSHTWIPVPGDDPGPVNVGIFDPSGTGMGGSPDNPLGGHHVQPDVRQVLQPKPHISQGVMKGLLICSVLPVYPVMARQMRIAGAVQLQATISRDGTIENLHVVSGPALLQAAALEAVRKWRYRPYLLNGEPVEVETTINVDFTMN
jgi:periplasmic protein TonB